MREELPVDGTEQALSDDGLLRGLAELREAGEIEEASLGLNAFDADMVQGHLRLFRRPAAGVVQSALLAGGYNLLNQEGLPLLVEAERRGIEIHMAGVFSSGLLAGGATVYATGSDSGQKPATELQELAAGWAELAEEHGLALPAVAMAFAALPKCVTKVVVGCSSVEDIEEDVRLLPQTAVPLELWQEAKRRGLLSASVPTP